MRARRVLCKKTEKILLRTNKFYVFYVDKLTKQWYYIRYVIVRINITALKCGHNI